MIGGDTARRYRQWRRDWNRPRRPSITAATGALTTAIECMDMYPHTVLRFALRLSSLQNTLKQDKTLAISVSKLAYETDL